MTIHIQVRQKEVGWQGQIVTQILAAAMLFSDNRKKDKEGKKKLKIVVLAA